jgi:hypothetical protein
MNRERDGIIKVEKRHTDEWLRDRRENRSAAEVVTDSPNKSKIGL